MIQILNVERNRIVRSSSRYKLVRIVCLFVVFDGHNNLSFAARGVLGLHGVDLIFGVWGPIVESGVGILVESGYRPLLDTRKGGVLLYLHMGALVIDRVDDSKGTFDGHEHVAFCVWVMLELPLAHQVHVFAVTLSFMHLKFSSLYHEVLLDPLKVLVFTVCDVEVLHQRFKLVDT